MFHQRSGGSTPKEERKPSTIQWTPPVVGGSNGSGIPANQSAIQHKKLLQAFGSFQAGLRAQYMFVSEEMERLSRTLKEIEEQQEELQARLREHCVALIKNKFTPEDLKTLEKLEEEEVRLATMFMATYKNLMEETQRTRRERLSDEQRVTKGRKSSAGATHSSEIHNLDTTWHNVASSKELMKQSILGGTLTSSKDEKQDFRELDIGAWELKLSEVKLDEAKKLGQGSFGSVVKGEWRGKEVAVKRIKISWDLRSEKTQALLVDFRRECACMCKLRHPNCLLLMGVCIDLDGEQLLMVTELMSGTVYDFLHKGEPVSFKQRMKFAKDCALGMNCLHLSDPPIMHLDLKTANLLVDKHMVAKVADFGLSKVCGPKEHTETVGSPVYMAPEVLDSQAYDLKADIYSFGIVLWELVTAKIPYDDNGFASGPRGLFQLLQYVVAGNRLDLPKDCPAPLTSLIARCWDGVPANRPSFTQILETHVLDDVILDSIISNKANALGKEFWKSSFSTREEVKEKVPWQQFAQALAKFINYEEEYDGAAVTDIRWRALRMMLANRNGNVRLEKFNSMLEWFGPFGRDTKMLEKMLKTLKLKGFWGEVESSEVTNLLAGKPVGTYIIRFSSQQAGCYTLTVVEEGVMQNYRIIHRAGKKFSLGNPPKKFNSLKAVIKAFQADLHLKAPLGNSPYANLFIEVEDDFKNNYVLPELPDSLKTAGSRVRKKGKRKGSRTESAANN